MRLLVAEVARRNKGWSMARLADKLELDHQTVMYWNQGRSYPRLPALVKMCRLLECTLEELLDPRELKELLQAGEPESFEDSSGNILENIPERRLGHAPQIVTSHGCRMGSC